MEIKTVRNEDDENNQDSDVVPGSRRSLQPAIRAKCVYCQGGGNGLSSRQLVGDCQIATCPLWPLRPWKHHYQGASMTPEERADLVSKSDGNYYMTDDSIPVRLNAAKHPESRSSAVDAMCFECVGGYCDSNPRGQVRDCAVTGCPLWTVRPWQDVKDRTAAQGLVETQDEHRF